MKCIFRERLKIKLPFTHGSVSRFHKIVENVETFSLGSFHLIRQQKSEDREKDIISCDLFQEPGIALTTRSLARTRHIRR